MRQLFSSVTKKCTKTAKIVTKIVILREIDKNSDENTPNRHIFVHWISACKFTAETDGIHTVLPFL